MCGDMSLNRPQVELRRGSPARARLEAERAALLQLCCRSVAALLQQLRMLLHLRPLLEERPARARLEAERLHVSRRLPL